LNKKSPDVYSEYGCSSKGQRKTNRSFRCKSNAIELTTLNSPVVIFRFLLFRQATTATTITAVTIARNVERLNSTHPTMSAVVAPRPFVAVELDPGLGVTVELEPDGGGEEITNNKIWGTTT